VLDRDDVNPVSFVIDAIDDAEVAATRAVQPRQFKPQRLPDTLRVFGQRPVDELDDRVPDLGRDLPQIALCRWSPRDLVGHLSARQQRPGLLLGEDLRVLGPRLREAVTNLDQQLRTRHDLESLFQ
jgi:hypothetical protein